MHGELANPLQRRKDVVADLGLHRNEIERLHADRATTLHTLAYHVEQLPVQVEPFVRPHEVASEHPLHQQLVAYLQRVHLRNGQLHERARWPHHERGHARQARRNRIGQRKIRRAAQTEVGPTFLKGSTMMVFCLAADSGVSRKRSASIERKPVVRFSCSALETGRRSGSLAGDDAGLDLHRLHDRL